MKLLILAVLALVPFACEATSYACATMYGSAIGVSGKVCFTQNSYSPNRVVEVEGTINGLTANAAHSLTIRAYGDNSDGCDNSGLILGDPDSQPPATGPFDGNLGDVTAAANGAAVVDLTETNKITLCGSKSVIGLLLVAHEGNTPVACGVIGKAKVPVTTVQVPVP